MEPRTRYCAQPALVAQLDRASDFESEGREFESLRARQQRFDLDLESLRCFLTVDIGRVRGSTRATRASNRWLGSLLGGRMNGLDFWRLCDELTVVQAALLIVGEDPARLQDYVDRNKPEDRPSGYDAAKAALTHAINAGRLSGRIVESHDDFGNGETDWSLTTVAADDLRNWLKMRGIKSGFFSPTPDVDPDYLSARSSHYSPKLAAAVKAWKAVSATPELRQGKSVKQAIVIWLRACKSSPASRRCNRQTFQSGRRICGFAQTLDCRTHHCVAQSLPKTRQGLGKPQPQGARVLAPRINLPHAQKTLQSGLKSPDRL
jgi:hypothetical protein